MRDAVPLCKEPVSDIDGDLVECGFGALMRSMGAECVYLSSSLRHELLTRHELLVTYDKDTDPGGRA